MKIKRPEEAGRAFTFVLLDRDEKIVRQVDAIP